MGKGQQEILTSILLTGILITVVGSVYLWGIPLIQKNRSAATLESAELFSKNLAEKIKFIANTGGKDQMTINIPGVVFFNNESGTIEIALQTEGTIYSTEGEIPIIGNYCVLTTGTWGVDKPEVLCATTKSLGENKYTTDYVLGFRPLQSENKIYKISLVGDISSGGIDHKIIIENAGSKSTTESGKVLIETFIKISII
jgi:hypothetical protein